MLRRVIQGPYRVGPWPGLTPNGGIVLLSCAVVLGVLDLLVDSRSLPVLGICALAPMAVATRVVNTPGAASAVCGAYLLPRSLFTLANPGAELPPLLLIPTVAFDLALWLRRSDMRWPWRKRRRSREERTVTWPRAASAGALFGVALSALQPTIELAPGLATIAACSVVALVSVRGTAA